MQLVDVHVRYSRRGNWVLRGIDAQLDPGDTVVLTGRNGSGKSTLLQALVGLLPLGQGSITDRPGTVAWIPERFPSNQPFKVLEYLELMAAVRGMPEPTERITRLSERLGLNAFFEEDMDEVSKGIVRKVALVQALLEPPGLLVADEPWDGLDSLSQSEVPKLLGEVVEAGGICVVTDHLGQASELSGVRHWELATGVITETATPTASGSTPRNGSPGEDQ